MPASAVNYGVSVRLSPKTWLDSHRALIVQLAARFGARRVRVFGSLARGDARDDSDVDLLVEFEPNRSLLDQVGLKQELETCLGRRVDVVAEGGISPYLRDEIMATAVPL